MNLGPPDVGGSGAVLVGTSQYADASLHSLPAVRNNVRDLSRLLRSPSHWGLPEDRCVSLVDPPGGEEIIRSVADMVERVSDTFVFYYSGHGLVSREGELILATVSTDSRLPQYTGVPYAWIREVIGRSRAARRIAIIDSCFSGRALHAMADAHSVIIGQVQVEGIYVLTSSPATSPSLALEGEQHTTFTGRVLDIVHDGVPEGSEMLSLDDIYKVTLQAMVRRGWPRPQQLGTGLMGQLPLLRNVAWFKKRPMAHSREHAEVPACEEVAEGVAKAVAVVSSAFGPATPDTMAALSSEFPFLLVPPQEENGADRGIRMVWDTMQAMRRNYGDGAATSALVLGRLVAESLALVRAGSDGRELETALGEHLLRADRELGNPSPAVPEVGDDQLIQVLRTALGSDEVIDRVVRAVSSVGAANVEVALGTTGAERGTTSFVLDGVVLSPNNVAGPLILENPWLVISPDGNLDLRTLRTVVGPERPSVLVIAPRLSIPSVRALLHVTKAVVVVKPADPQMDLRALREKLEPGEETPAWRRARRAVISIRRTTIEISGVDLQLARNRIVLVIESPDHDGRHSLAIRALAVAQSAAQLGVVPGGGRHMAAVASTLRDGTGGASSADLVSGALSEPLRVLRELEGDEPAGDAPLDSRATLRGAVSQAAATLGAFLFTC